VEQFKYLGTTKINKIPFMKKLRAEYRQGMLAIYSANLLSFSLLSKNIKIKIYRTTTFCVILFQCKTWSLTLREDHKLRVSENRVLRRIFGQKRDEIT
jgi:hypothetical protein